MARVEVEWVAGVIQTYKVTYEFDELPADVRALVEKGGDLTSIVDGSADEYVTVYTEMLPEAESNIDPEYTEVDNRVLVNIEVVD